MTLVLTGDTTASAWRLPPALVAERGMSPSVAMSPNGTTTAIWVGPGLAGASSIVSADRPPGAEAFLPPTTLASSADGVGWPQVAYQADGTVTAVWHLQRGRNTVVQAATRAPGAPAFGAPEDLSAAGSPDNWQAGQQPTLSVAADGGAVVTWVQAQTLGPARIQAALRGPGESAFGAAVSLSAPDDFVGDPNAAAGPSGHALIAWTRTVDNGHAVIDLVRRRSIDRPLSAPQTFGGESRSHGNARVAVTPTGDEALGWVSSTAGGPDYDFRVRVRLAGTSGFGTPDLVTDPGADPTEPSLQSGRDGTLVAAWTDVNDPEGLARATVATRPAGASAFDPPVAVSDPSKWVAGARLAVGPEGDAVLAWAEGAFPDDDLGIMAAVRPFHARGFGAPVPLTGPMNAMVGGVAAGPGGRASVVWQSLNGGIESTSSDDSVPTFIAEPEVAGRPSRGSIVRCTAYETVGAATETVTWVRNGTPVGTGATLSLTKADVGQAIACRVTATNDGGTTTATSEPVTITTPSSPKPPCPQVVLVGLRGSGDNGGSVPLFGTAGSAFAKELRRRLTIELGASWVKSRFEDQGLGYPAVDVPVALAAPPLYVASKDRGTANLLSYLSTAYTDGCAGTKFVLFGYSQGAHAIGDALAADGPIATLKRILAVVLLGDPTFNPKDQHVSRLGGYGPRYGGLLGRRPAGDFRGAGEMYDVLSYCHGGDLICQGRKYLTDSEFVPNAFASMGPHENYHLDGTTVEAAKAMVWRIAERVGG